MDEALKGRIEDRLKEFSTASDISIARLDWGPSDFQMGPGTGIQPAGPTLYPLAVTVGTNRKVIKFTEDELNDCSFRGTRENTAWQGLEHRLKEFLKKFTPEKNRIGF